MDFNSDEGNCQSCLGGHATCNVQKLISWQHRIDCLDPDKLKLMNSIGYQYLNWKIWINSNTSWRAYTCNQIKGKLNGEVESYKVIYVHEKLIIPMMKSLKEREDINIDHKLNRFLIDFLLRLPHEISSCTRNLNSAIAIQREEGTSLQHFTTF